MRVGVGNAGAFLLLFALVFAFAFAALSLLEQLAARPDSDRIVTMVRNFLVNVSPSYLTDFSGVATIMPPVDVISLITGGKRELHSNTPRATQYENEAK